MERTYWIRNGGFALVGVIVGVCAAAGLNWLQVEALDANLIDVYPARGQMDKLLGDFTNAAFVAGVLTMVLVLVWHIVALLQPGRYSFVLQWWCCAAVSTVAAMIAVAVMASPPERGVGWLYLMAAVNGALVFWLATVAATPDPIRFAPPGSFRLRTLFDR